MISCLIILMDPNTPRNYDLEIQINEKKVPMIPFIQNIFGNVFYAMIKELNEIEPIDFQNYITCKITPNSDHDNRVVLAVENREIKIKPFIQDMLWKTLTGYLSTLKKIPVDLMTLNISIKIKPISEE